MSDAVADWQIDGGRARLWLGDCLQRLRGLDDGAVDAVVTDPPYGLSFMRRRWDAEVPSVDVWREALRVLKPGGHLLCFAGTRTHHRMACAIEDAGFEIRDMLAWVYGSGFPKSHDVGKAIDREAGVKGELGAPKSAAHAGWIERGRMRGKEGHEGYQRPWMENQESVDRNARVYIPGSPEAKQWQGWGTALKPALEPITLARKPLAGTVAENVLQHGTGALNVDGCRVGNNGGCRGAGYGPAGAVDGSGLNGKFAPAIPGLGRWPANLIHDGGEEVSGLLGDAARFFYCPKAGKTDRYDGCDPASAKNNMRVNAPRPSEEEKHSTRRANHHPTVKPTDLMRYLCRLVTPPGGLVLDPFAGSGSTGKAAMLEGFRFLGIELDLDYLRIARDRIAWAFYQAEQTLFSSVGDADE